MLRLRPRTLIATRPRQSLKFEEALVGADRMLL